MKALWDKNQGLQSRFTGTIHFPDFPPCTLTEIAVKMLASSQVYMQGEQYDPGTDKYCASKVLPIRGLAGFASGSFRMSNCWRPVLAGESAGK